MSGEILNIAKRYLTKVKPSGSDNIMAVCPFHSKSDGTSEKHPSFAMSLTTGLWFCHACQEKGNLLSFLKKVGLPRDQIDLHYGLTIENAKKAMPVGFDPAKPGVVSEDPIPESLLGVFDYCPTDLLNAGFLESTLQHFEVGFDTTHYRITYPIRDLLGNLIAISGGTVLGVHPKYKVYDEEYKVWGLPPRLWWNKRVAMWNSHIVYPELFFQSRPSHIVLVEGFKACMWVWQSGIKNVVALLGTYLSQEQKWVLERIGAPVYLFLDNNDAGVTGVVKSAEQLKRSLRIFVVDYPERLKDDVEAQPDSLSDREVNIQVASATNYFDWKTRRGLWRMEKEQYLRRC
jgi:DNA primase